MKKIHRFVRNCLFGMILVLLSNVSVSADGTVSRVYDQYGVLSTDEERLLDEILQKFYDSYGFEAVILISRDVAGDERTYAAQFMQQNGIGCGESKNGMCLFNQPGRRNVAVVFRGEAQDDFDTRIQDILLDDCTGYLKADDYYGAYMSVLCDLEGGLARWSRGKSVRPMDIDGEGLLVFGAGAFLLSFAAMAVPVLFMVLYQKGKMKTFVAQSNADAYREEDGVRLDAHRDIYLRTLRTRTEKPSNDSHSGGGSSGTFTSSGESFSGSSRNY